MTDVGSERFDEVSENLRRFAEEANKPKEARFSAEERWEALKMDMAVCDYLDKNDETIPLDS